MSLSIRLTEVSQSRLLSQEKNQWASTTIFSSLLLCPKQQQQEGEKREKLLPGQRAHTQTGSSRAGLNSPWAARSPPRCRSDTPAHAALPGAKPATGSVGREPTRLRGKAHGASPCNPPCSPTALLAGGGSCSMGGDVLHPHPACPRPSAACPQDPRAAAKVSAGTRMCSRTVADHSTVTRDWNNCCHLVWILQRA